MARRDDEQDRAFVDIKSMISQYRRDRAGSKENKQEYSNKAEAIGSDRPLRSTNFNTNTFGETPPII